MFILKRGFQSLLANWYVQILLECPKGKKNKRKKGYHNCRLSITRHLKFYFIECLYNTECFSNIKKKKNASLIGLVILFSVLNEFSFSWRWDQIRSKEMYGGK